MSSTVKQLSASKQKASLGEVKNLEKAKAMASKKYSRTTVLNPNELDWPVLEELDERELISLLSTDLQCLKQPNKHVPLNVIQKVEKSNRRNFRQEYYKQRASEIGYDLSNYTLIRSHICLGVNSVSTALESDLLISIIIERDVDPTTITKLLIPPSRSRNVPIIAITGLSKTCQEVFQTRCIALGLKANCSSPDHAFGRIHKAVTSIVEKKQASASKHDIQTTCGDIGKRAASPTPHSDSFRPPKIRKI